MGLRKINRVAQLAVLPYLLPDKLLLTTGGSLSRRGIKNQSIYMASYLQELITKLRRSIKAQKQVLEAS